MHAIHRFTKWLWRKVVPVKPFKKIVLLDFDGVLHSYSSGWQGAAVISDPPVDGAIEWLQEFLWCYCTPPDRICAMGPIGDWEISIYSTRSRQRGGIRAMKQWLLDHNFNPDWLEAIKFPTKKPPAFITVDDRAIMFNGEFDMLTSAILHFKPWNKRGV